MGIEPVTAYRCVCDQCGLGNGTEYPRPETARGAALRAGYQLVGVGCNARWLCPSCVFLARLVPGPVPE